MWTFTEEHQIILERLYRSAISAGAIWDEYKKNKLQDLWSSDYIDLINGHWAITVRGVARMKEEKQS